MGEITKQEINGISTSLEHVSSSVNELSRSVSADFEQLLSQIQLLNSHMLILNILLGGLLICTLIGLLLIWKNKR